MQYIDIYRHGLQPPRQHGNPPQSKRGWSCSSGFPFRLRGVDDTATARRFGQPSRRNEKLVRAVNLNVCELGSYVCKASSTIKKQIANPRFKKSMNCQLIVWSIHPSVSENPHVKIRKRRFRTSDGNTTIFGNSWSRTIFCGCPAMFQGSISTFGCQISRLFTHLHLKSTSLVLFVPRGLII